MTRPLWDSEVSGVGVPITGGVGVSAMRAGGITSGISVGGGGVASGSIQAAARAASSNSRGKAIIAFIGSPGLLAKFPLDKSAGRCAHPAWYWTG